MDKTQKPTLDIEEVCTAFLNAAHATVPFQSEFMRSHGFPAVQKTKAYVITNTAKQNFRAEFSTAVTQEKLAHKMFAELGVCTLEHFKLIKRTLDQNGLDILSDILRPYRPSQG